MNKLSETIASRFAHSYRDFRDRVRVLAGGLSEEQFWTKPFPFGNSFGNLVLHLTGNLSYYIGTQLANTGYTRDRELEFTQTRLGQKEETLKCLDDAVAMVVACLHNQTDDDWSRPYQAKGVDDVPDRFSIFLKCSAHFHHHIGQMIYLAKELSRKLEDGPAA